MINAVHNLPLCGPPQLSRAQNQVFAHIQHKLDGFHIRTVANFIFVCTHEQQTLARSSITNMATTAHDNEHSHSHGCCGSGHDHDRDYDDDDVVLDPTLASCCERDQQQYDKAMKLKRLLTAHDPTSGGVRLRQQLFEPTHADLAPANQSQVQQQLEAQTRMLAALQLEKQQKERRSSSYDDDDDESGSDEFDDSDLEGDDAMSQVLAARRKELEAQMQLALRNAADGYGVVTETDLTQLLQDVQAAPAIPRVVLVTSASSSNSDTIDAVLHEMRRVAATFVGTKFAVARVRAGHDTGVSPRDVHVKTLPSIVAFRDGEQIDATALDARASVDAATLWEAKLVPWLSMCSVLQTTRQEQSTRASTRTKTARDDDKESEQPANDCGIENCRIRYGFAHEHVGSSQEARREVSAWRS